MRIRPTDRRRYLLKEFEESDSFNRRQERRSYALMAIMEDRISIPHSSRNFHISRQAIARWAHRLKRNQSILDAPRSGRPREWDKILAKAVRESRKEEGKHWNTGTVRRWVAREIGKEVSESTVKRYLKKKGYVWNPRRGIYDET